MRAIIFDLDDTLLVDEAVSYEVLEEIAQQAKEKLGFSPELLVRDVATVAQELWRKGECYPFCHSIGISAFECLWGNFLGDSEKLSKLRTWSQQYREDVFLMALKKQQKLLSNAIIRPFSKLADASHRASWEEARCLSSESPKGEQSGRLRGQVQGVSGAQTRSVQEHTAGREAARSNAEGSPKRASLAGASELLLEVPEAGKLRDGLLQAGTEGVRRVGASEPNASTGATQQFAAAGEFGKRSIIARSLAQEFSLLRRQRQRLFPGTREVLEKLAQHYQLGLLTNGAPDLQREKINAMKCDHLFSAVTISGEYGVGKPNPAIFNHLLVQLGVKPEEAIMVGNSLERDIAGARAAGIASIWMRLPGEKDSMIVPDFTISHLGQLLKIFTET